MVPVCRGFESALRRGNIYETPLLKSNIVALNRAICAQLSELG